MQLEQKGETQSVGDSHGLMERICKTKLSVLVTIIISNLGVI